jgi:Omp85 superfamily domain
MKDRKYPVRRSIWVACGRDSGSPSAKGGNQRHTRSRAIFEVLAICLAATSVHAQSARELETTCREVEETERQKPSLRTRVERLVKAVMVDTSSKSGFYPQIDSVYAGGGFTPGVGYRGRSGDQIHWNVRGLYSIKNYKLVELTARLADVDRSLELDLRTGWRDATQVGFYGLGMATVPDDRADFRLQMPYAGGSITWRPSRWSVLIGDAQYEGYRTLSPTGSERPVEEAYTPLTAPGLGADPSYVHGSGVAAIDWRSSPGYTRSGGYYGVAFHEYIDTDQTFSFKRLDLNLVQHLPIYRETWVVSLRSRVQTTLDGEDLIPYFMMPSLGSGSTLRAYSSWRFRDRHSILTSVEWRWIPDRPFDIAVFADAGKVVPRTQDLNLKDLRGDVGIGIRFHGPKTTPLRIEVANGTDGWQLVFAGTPAF